ncbi:MAG: hypothetical protein ACW976_00150 [Candidatus Ranarchaeia archaeon]
MIAKQKTTGLLEVSGQPKRMKVDGQHPNENLREIAGIVELLNLRLKENFGTSEILIMGQTPLGTVLLAPNGGTVNIEHVSVSGLQGRISP